MTAFRNRGRLTASFSLFITLTLFPFYLHAQRAPEQVQALDQILASAGYTGVLVLMNPASDVLLQGTYHNTADSIPALNLDSKAIPASTFKIFSTMAALQEGVVENAESVIPWDGVERSRPEINQDLTLADAYRYSAVPHYQSMVQTIGEPRMQYWLDQAEYGNRNLGGGLTTFWLAGELRITPRQQLDLLQALNEQTLPFDLEVQQQVKEIMINREEAGVVVRGKTGLAVFDNGLNTGWWVGWTDDGAERWYFATLLQAGQHTINASDNAQAALIASRQSVVDRALRELKILPPSTQ